MQASELKFLLKLLGHPNYRASITQLKPNNKTSAPERDRICRDLAKREYISYSREIRKFRIESAGKNLLKQKDLALPLTEHQFAVLEACRETVATPGSVKKVPATERQAIIQDLEAKGFIKAEKVEIKEVWLTEEGYDFLKNQYYPEKSSATISLNLLNSYIVFLRKANSYTDENQTGNLSMNTEQIKELNERLDEEQILSLIKQLDYELGTENYLPIFCLREKLQLQLSRDEVDQTLYSLEQQNRIVLSSLVEAIHYTTEQIQAGIPQPSGGPLFFIEVK